MVWSAVVWVAVWAACGLVGVNGQANGGFWWLTTPSTIAATTTTTTTPQEPVYCECVPYYICINNTIDTSGAGVIDIRVGPRGTTTQKPRITNVERCPNILEICCGLPPNATPKPIEATTTQPLPTLPPDTPCECVSFVNCTNDKLVSDGKGDTSLQLLGIGSYSHSNCPQALAVCCAIDLTTTPPAYSSTTAPLSTCECVEAYQCDENGYIITDGSTLINIRTKVQPNSENQCPGSYRCCRLPSDSTITSTTTTTTTTTTTPPPPQVYSCGIRNTFGIKTRIIGFREGESQFGEFPWVAAILNMASLMGKVVRRFVGGGSLIHPRVVITAAHKVVGQDYNALVTRLGEWDTKEELEPYPFQDIEVERVIVHPQFNPSQLWNDVALLILKEDARLQSHINTICVASDLQNIDTTACIINGWGLNGFNASGEYQQVMKSLTLPLVDHNQCVASLQTTRLGHFFQLHNSFICAGGEAGKDACRGDGGGPLACPSLDDPTRYLLVGMTAWGIGCGQEGIPGVYVNVPPYRQWVQAQIDAWLPTTTPPPTTTIANATDYFDQLQSGNSSIIDADIRIADEGVKGTRQEERERTKQERERKKQERQQQRRQNRNQQQQQRQQNKEQRRQANQRRRQARQEQ